jgi:sigma-B regulation protein RsbU (phosphoserine phosphatase)
MLPSEPDPLPATTDPRTRALIVDDSRAQRRVLALQLQRWGYDVTEAASGGEALVMCAATPYDIIISDWMMPGLTGVEFCREIRALPSEIYSYFILLTSKSDTAEITRGLEAGADDFLTKPFNADELRARLRAGERIVGMQRQLVQKNQVIRAALEEIQSLYDSLDRDLQEARKLQLTLMRDRRHGVASAMMTARLAGLLSGGSPDQNIAIRKASLGQQFAWSPDTVASKLNRLMIEDVQADQYFTLAYAEVDMVTGNLALVQAGHPHPVILRQDGQIDVIGVGGLPIGLIADAGYETVMAQLSPGDRLILASDGITECPSPLGEELGQDGFLRLLARLQTLPSDQLIEALQWELVTFHGKAEFPDDVSAIIFDYSGPNPPDSARCTTA